jgi:predicted HNH restriction endonuclease
MSKRLLSTPKSQIRAALRQLFLKSRERASAIKRDGYSCQVCGAKQSRAKGKEVFVEVHHRHGIKNWEWMTDAIKMYLLNEADMETLCKKCHEEKTDAR